MRFQPGPPATMIIQIENILSREECLAIREALETGDHWVDGKATAAGAARRAKLNLQGDRASAAVKGCTEKAKLSLLANSIFCAAAQPDVFSRVIVNRYGLGNSYGDHVDAPYIDNVRTDLSFTLFLSEPQTYGGGDLVIEHPGHSDAIKGPLGSVVLYPSTALHRVEEVTSGERLAIVGWLRSRVKSAEAREMIFELEQIITDLKARGEAAHVTRLANMRNNLIRHFGG